MAKPNARGEEVLKTMRAFKEAMADIPDVIPDAIEEWISIEGLSLPEAVDKIINDLKAGVPIDDLRP